MEIGNFRAAVACRCYTDCVPREVLLPSGPPDRLCESRSGISIEASHARPPRPPENLAHRCDCRRTFLSFGPPGMLPTRRHPAPHRAAARRKLQGRKRRSKCRRVEFFEGNNHRKETREGDNRSGPLRASNLLKTWATNVLFPSSELRYEVLLTDKAEAAVEAI